ncbi:MAG TPA: glutathione S-transferase, partial [Rhizomicrobium sp.]
MKLYDSQTAPNPRRVRVFLAEKGVSVAVEPVDIVTAENRQPAFRAKNPTGGVPVLELDDGSFIAESVAICRYFEELHPAPPLMGTDAKDRAVVEMWQRRMELELFNPITQVFRNGHPFF